MNLFSIHISSGTLGKSYVKTGRFPSPKCPPPRLHIARKSLQHCLRNLLVAASRDGGKSWNISGGSCTWAALGHSNRGLEHWTPPLTPAFITLYAGHSEKFILGGGAQEMTPSMGYLRLERVMHEAHSAKRPKCYTYGSPVTSQPARAIIFIAL